MTERATTKVRPTCHTCGYVFSDGEPGWVEDWRVIDVSGTTATFRTEQRYTCDGCEGSRTQSAARR